jgi:hypothetical protein
MNSRFCRSLVLVFAAVALGAATLSARLGESGADLRKRLGRPESQPSKNVLAWLIEEPAGALLYTVTLDERGISIAEGLKPFRQATLSEQTARNFIAEQLSILTDKRTARVVKPGESYVFGGETLTCGANEHVVVDDANNLLLVWTTKPASVMAVRREVLQAAR